MNDGQLILVSNRGPHDFVWENDRWTVRRANGGLVSMVEPLARRPDVAWFCCVSEPPAAGETPDALMTTAADQTDPELGVVPVPVPASVYHKYYGLISNEVLWMLQHHLVGQFGYENLDADRHRAWTEGYLAANRLLADSLAASGRRPRAFLIQDYHLYPLPSLLREHFPRTRSLHFTHIPFPDPQTLKLIPREWRRSILTGLLGADVVGMQTRQDVLNFLHACFEIPGARVDPERSIVSAPDGRRVQVRSYPASVDPNAVRAVAASEQVTQARERLAFDPARPTIIRVDRLDPSKNQLIGFMAFARLLETRPDLRGKARFLAFLIPSRTDLGVYRAYTDEVYKIVKEINTRFASADPGDAPIQIFYTNDREQAMAAMSDCDVLLANSREDGMNLVVKEWAIVSRRPGVVIVSETAGSSQEVGDDALLVSPLDIEGTARALAEAIDMGQPERAARLERIRARVLQWTAADWLAAQLKDLQQAA